MNIDTSRLTYNPIQRSSRPTQELRTDPKKFNPPKVERKDEFTPRPSEETPTPEKPSSDKNQWTSPLSHYLSPAEKAMLNELFPPPGRHVGIRAYRQGQQPVLKKTDLGKRIDLKT